MKIELTDTQLLEAVVENLTEDANNLWETFRATGGEPDNYHTFAAILKVMWFYGHEWVAPVAEQKLEEGSNYDIQYQFHIEDYP